MRRVSVNRSALRRGDRPGRRRSLDVVSIGLLEAGVDRIALHSTLVQEGREDLRSLITAERYYDAENYVQWLYFYPAADRDRKRFLRNVYQCDLIYNLFFKECRLSGLRVGRIDVVDAEIDNQAYREPMRDIMPATEDFTPFVFMPDFFPDIRNGLRYSNPEVEEHVERFIYERTVHGEVGMVLQGICAPHLIDRWWSPRLVAKIVRNALIFEIACKPTEGAS